MKRANIVIGCLVVLLLLLAAGGLYLRRQDENRISELKEAIDRLPEPGKTILHCCYFKHMTYQQAAEQLQLTLVVIKKNMLKVFKILRKELNKPI